MNPLIILNLANAAMSLIENLLPQIQQFVQKGEVTAEQQAEIKARYESLKARADGQFSGPEWQVVP